MTTREKISILLPCKEQREEYLSEAVGSVLAQTSPHWELLVGIDPQAPRWIEEWFERQSDPRVRITPLARSGFAAALNALLADAHTPFVSILLSDDRYALQAVATLLEYRRRFPDVDFFHTSRRYIDEEGRPFGSVMPSGLVELAHFKRWGSPVKHLLCWRRELGNQLGGMDESLSLIGCDDFDFPWRMAEAGARFHAVPECLYEYRVHDRSPRLTTTTPPDEHLEIVAQMFRKHRVSRAETCAFLQHAARSYVFKAYLGSTSHDSDHAFPVRCFREADQAAWPRFQARGFRRRHFFPHRVYVLPRGGPDGAKIAQQMCGVYDPEVLRQVLLFALPEAIEEFPRGLFFDDDLLWHRQQLGLPGQVASATFVAADNQLYVTLALSDLVQRISRHREHKTRVETVFKGWAFLLLNAVMEHALDAGFATVFVPTSRLAMAHTDEGRAVQPQLFQRVYDQTLQRVVRAERSGDWWRIDLEGQEDRVVPLERRVTLHRREKMICIAHDIERGLGHCHSDPDFAARAERSAPEALRQMLSIEAALGVEATYCVAGSILEEIRGAIEAGGHALGFHSYAHALPGGPSIWRRLSDRLFHAREDPQRVATRSPEFLELVRCRHVDYRLKGYRPPQSRIGPGLDDRHLAYFGFEWLASSAWSLGFERPRAENGIVKIPIHLDDYDLHRGTFDYDGWERRLLELVEEKDFIAVGLHDCYADHWLSRYGALIARLGRLGTFRTFDQVADDEMLANSGWC